MRVDLIKVLVAAVAGGAITYVAGPIAKRWVERHSYGSHWAGEWQTVTCHEGGTFNNWTIYFDQEGDTVTGRYVGAHEISANYSGRMAGEVNLTQLSGTWSQTAITEVLDGAFTFVMIEDGDAFEGTYTLDNRQRIWYGRRDGRLPNCSTG